MRACSQFTGHPYETAARTFKKMTFGHSMGHSGQCVFFPCWSLIRYPGDDLESGVIHRLRALRPTEIRLLIKANLYETNYQKSCCGHCPAMMSVRPNDQCGMNRHTNGVAPQRGAASYSRISLNDLLVAQWKQRQVHRCPCRVLYLP